MVIFSGLPASAFWLVGLVLGIDFLMTGVTHIQLGIIEKAMDQKYSLKKLEEHKAF